MNRRRFSSAVLGAGSLLVSGLARSPAMTAARTTDEDDDRDSGRSSEATEEELLEHIIDSSQRSYECEDPVTFITALAIEFDKKRNAADAFDYVRESSQESFEDVELDDEGDFGDLTDQGYCYVGVSGSGRSEVNVAMLYVQQGEMIYAIVSAGEDDQVAVVGEYYETLFDEDREETDALLTEDEMPRGFLVSEGSGQESDPADDEPVEDDRGRDEDEDDDRGGRKGIQGIGKRHPTP